MIITKLQDIYVSMDYLSASLSNVNTFLTRNNTYIIPAYNWLTTVNKRKKELYDYLEKIHSLPDSTSSMYLVDSYARSTGVDLMGRLTEPCEDISSLKFILMTANAFGVCMISAISDKIFLGLQPDIAHTIICYQKLLVDMRQYIKGTEEEYY